MLRTHYFDNIPLGVVIIEGDKVIYYNKKVEEYYELDHLPEVIPEAFVIGAGDEFKKLKDNNEIGKLQIKTKKNNNEYILDIYVGYIQEEDKKYTLLIIVNVTILMKIKKLSEQKEQLINNMPEILIDTKEVINYIYSVSQILKWHLSEHNLFKLIVTNLDDSIYNLSQLIDKLYYLVSDIHENSTEV